MSAPDPRNLLGKLDDLERLRNPQQITGKRQFVRFVVRGDAELQPMDRNDVDHGTLRIQLRDLGRAGIGFICDQPLERNSTWLLNFLHHNHVVATQPLIIRHCRKVEDELYLIGGQFCIDTGLMRLMGIDANAVTEGDAPTARGQQGLFLSPGEVA